MKITCYLSQCTIFPYFIVPCHRSNHIKRAMLTMFTNFNTFCAFETGIWCAQEKLNFPLHQICYHNSNTSLRDVVQWINSLHRDATSHTQLTFPFKLMHWLFAHCKAPPLLYSVLYIYVFFFFFSYIYFFLYFIFHSKQKTLWVPQFWKIILYI